MRIGLITGEYPPLQGGVGNLVAILAERLTQQGHPTFIFSNNRTEQQHDAIPLTNHVSKWGYRTNQHVQQWAHDNQLDVVNLHFQTASYDMSAWVHFMPHRVDVPFVTTFHDLRFPYLFPKAGALRDWIVMHLAKASDGVIVTNHEDFDRIQHLRSAMIPIGSNIHRANHIHHDAVRDKLGLQRDDFVLAYFGFINHSKGVDTLLHAIAKIADPTLKLVMIGGRTGTADPTNKTYADTIDTLITDLNLGSQVSWTGFATNEDVGQYLKVADIVTLPFRDGASFRRGSLMASIEQGCAIITTYPSVSVPEFTEDSLMLVPAESPVELAEAIQALRKNPEYIAQLRAHTERLRTHFDWDVIAQETVNFLRTTIETRT